MVRVRLHGAQGPSVAVLHGGPAAVGEAEPIARGLADRFRVLEPWQRGSGSQPLTVARHVADLDALLAAHCRDDRVGLVGASWGAMLALAYAADHPGRVRAIVLIGCGTFEPTARERMREILRERMDERLRARMASLREEIPDPQQRLARQYELMRPLYEFDPLPEETPAGPAESLDVRAHAETWEDMLRLQRNGAYPAAFARIPAPVLMLHGAFDPHPGRMIRDHLRGHLPQLAYREWAACGHSPWRERRVRAAFFETLRTWLTEQL
ncbi:MAG: alpha/beta fold hydrolase [Candidatus Eisenbacteria bacterium]|nr:alpha/beta fold hydrolase [Candidatus Eisenbacteria bacterium]